MGGSVAATPKVSQITICGAKGRSGGVSRGAARRCPGLFESALILEIYPFIYWSEDSGVCVYIGSCRFDFSVPRPRVSVCFKIITNSEELMV